MATSKRLNIAEIASFIDDKGLEVCNVKPVRKLEKQRDALLRVLVDELSMHEEAGWYICEDVKTVIEEVTGRSWEEIEEEEK